MCAFDSIMPNNFQDFSQNIWDYNLQNVSCKWLVNAHMIAVGTGYSGSLKP
jgi:hypothetical protein